MSADSGHPNTGDVADEWLRASQKPEDVQVQGKPSNPCAARVYLHTRDQGRRKWTNELYYFARIPVVGEYIILSSAYENYYEVQLVAHTPAEPAYDADVYAVAKNHLDAKQEAFTDV